MVSCSTMKDRGVKLKTGLFGAAVNAAVILGVSLYSGLARDRSEAVLYLSAIPVLAVSAFVVYYVVVSSYVAKRSGIVNPVFFDSLVGMLAEIIIVTVGTSCYSLWNTLSNMSGKGLSAFANDFAAGFLVNILWVFGLFMVHILIAGNIAGLVGWGLLKKYSLKPRS
jgi:hypothetical protein